MTSGKPDHQDTGDAALRDFPLRRLDFLFMRGQAFRDAQRR